MRDVVLALAMIAVAYVVGSIPSGFLVIKATTGKDIRRYGSGNIGMANAYRVGGLVPAGLVLLGDALKGALPVLAARHLLGLPDLAVVLIGAAAIAGHDFPVFLRGQGGKGVATSLGVISALAPPVGLAAVLIWWLVILICRYASLASLTMPGAASLLMLVYDLLFLGWRHLVVTLFIVALFVVAIYQHRANIDRLLHGRELKITEKPEQAA